MDKKKSENIKVEAEAKIKKVVIKQKTGELEFDGLDMNSDDIRRLNIWAKDKETMVVQIVDEEEVIASAAKIKKVAFDAKQVQPYFEHMDFSSDQYGELANIVKSGTTIKVIVEHDVTNQFNFMNEDESGID